MLLLKPFFVKLSLIKISQNELVTDKTHFLHNKSKEILIFLNKKGGYFDHNF